MCDALLRLNDDVTYVYDDVTYVYDDVTYVYAYTCHIIKGGKVCLLLECRSLFFVLLECRSLLTLGLF